MIILGGSEAGVCPGQAGQSCHGANRPALPPSPLCLGQWGFGESRDVGRCFPRSLTLPGAPGCRQRPHSYPSLSSPMAQSPDFLFPHTEKAGKSCERVDVYNLLSSLYQDPPKGFPHSLGGIHVHGTDNFYAPITLGRIYCQRCHNPIFLFSLSSSCLVSAVSDLAVSNNNSYGRKVISHY